MSKRAQGWFCTVLLTALFLFYANEIWRSSRILDVMPREHPHEPIAYPPLGENILEAVWYWTTKDALSFYTSLLASFTVVLAVTSFLQYRALMASVRESKRSATIQARLTRQSIDLAREESKRAHRAKLAMRRIHNARFVTGNPIKIQVDIVNKGTREATVIASGSDVFLRPKDPYENRSFDANFIKASTNNPLRPGDMYAFETTGSNPNLSADEIAKIIEGKVDVIFIANLQYTDDAGVQVASFFRIYDPEIGSFRRAQTAAESQEWEYTD
jgi:hypothetical protein